MKDLMGNGQGGLLTLSVHTILNRAASLPRDLCHSHYTSLTIKNAICDVVRDKHPTKERPNVDPEDPDVPLVAILLGRSESDGSEAASISLYRCLHSPGSLHKRGYRSDSAIHKAAMKESMAAGLLYEAGWHTRLKESSDRRIRFIDPMAGSGSLVLEGMMMMNDIAPGLMRIRCSSNRNHKLPPVSRWKSSASGSSIKELWKKVVLDATQRAKIGSLQSKNNKDITFHVNDIHSGALNLFHESFYAAGFTPESFRLHVSNVDCYDLDVEVSDDTPIQDFVVVNPPWGVRLMTDDMVSSWKSLRYFVRDTLASSVSDNTEFWLLSGNKLAPQSYLRLKRNRMIPVQTGDINLRWIQYTIHNQNSSSSSKQQNAEQREQDEDVDDDAVDNNNTNNNNDDDIIDDQTNDSEEEDDDNPNNDDMKTNSNIDEEVELQSLTVAQLKDKLRDANLPVSGKKAMLIERLSSSLSEVS